MRPAPANTSPAPAGSHPAATAWWALLVTTVMQATMSFALLAPTGIAPEIAAAVGVPSSYVGYHVSLAYGAGMVMSLYSGLIIRRFGPVRANQAAVTFGALGSLLATAGVLPLMALGSLVMGVGIGLTTPAASHLLARFTPAHRRNLIFSIKQTGVPLGGILAGIVGPPIAVAFGWRWSLVAVVAFAIAVVLAAQPSRDRWDDDRDPNVRLRGNPFHDLAIVFRVPALKWLLIAGFWLSLVQLSFVGFLVTILVEEIGFTLLAAGFLLSLSQAAGVGGRTLWGFVADRVQNGLGVLLVLCSASFAVMLAAMTLTPAWPPLAVQILFVLLALTAVGWNGVHVAETARLSPPGLVGAATGASVSLVGLGALVGPSSFATVYNIIGSYAHAFGLLAVAGAFSIVCLWLSRAAAKGDA
ncbi:MAG: MFS transporter [Rhodospirillales bacterium]|nr:MFS transporter [Rhodospirillales bacterium]